MTVGGCGTAMREMHSRYGWEYIYRQLAEECSELSKASLKVIRATNKETPDTIEVSMNNYIEELADTWLMIAIARTDLTQEEKNLFDKTVENKFNRLMDRLKNSAEQG